MSKGKLACTLPWLEIVGTANFKRDFLKVVDFLHYLKAEGYDMVTFDKVGNGIIFFSRIGKNIFTFLFTTVPLKLENVL